MQPKKLYTTNRVNEKFENIILVLKFPYFVCQNVTDSIRCCCATNRTRPSKKPTENGVENLFTMNVPTMAIPSCIIAVQIPAIINGHDAPLSCKLITMKLMTIVKSRETKNKKRVSA